MGKNQSASNLPNIIQYNNGSINFVSGSTLLMQISSSGAITTTGVISGSNALSSSYAVNSERLDNLDSTSFVFTSSYNSDSSSFSTRTTNLETASGSFSTRVTKIEGNYATTGSNVFLGAQTVCANITSTGTIIAQTLNVQQVTSSIVYSCGSNTFGCALTDVQQFTGSVRVTGSNALFSVGCIGIGTTTPATNLHIFSNTNTGLRINAGALNGSAELDLLSNGTQNAFIDFGPNDLRFRSTNADMSAINSGSILVLQNNGNVGIGSIAPEQSLDIVKSNSALSVGLFIKNNAASAVGNASTIWFGTWSGASTLAVHNAKISAINMDANSAATDLAFYTYRGNGTAAGICERMRIQAEGNVGINCSSPGFTLDVNGTLNVCTSTGSQIRMISYGGSSAKIRGTQGTLGVEACGALTLETNGANERLRIESLGIACFSCQVCVGGNLIVNGGTIELNCSNTTNTDARINMYTSNNVNGDRATIYGYNLAGTTTGNEITYLAFGYCSTNVQGYINMQTKSSTAWCNTLTIINGRVGIGTASPTGKLTVEGTVGTEIVSIGSSAQKLYFWPDGGGVMLSTATSQGGEGIYFGNGSDFMYFQTAATERMRITSGGLILSNTTTSRTTGYTTNPAGHSAAEFTNYGGAQWFTNVANSEGTYIVLGKSRGTTVNSVTAVTSGDILGGLIFQGTDGTGALVGSGIFGHVDGAVSTNNIPGRLSFWTSTANGSLVERARITSAGIACFACQIQIPMYRVSKDSSAYNFTFARFFNSSTLLATLSGEATGTTAVAKVEYVNLYAYADHQQASGLLLASIRRAYNSTAWCTINNVAAMNTICGGATYPALCWHSNGALCLHVGGSNEVTAKISITHYQSALNICV